MLTQPLDGNAWTVACVEAPADAPPLPDRTMATVPGCVHTDLLAAGLIPDPFHGEQERQVQWVSACTWRYERSFDLEPAVLDSEHVELCFSGLDTLATIELNGATLGHTQNMHRRYRFDVQPHLHVGSNHLVVTLRPALPHALARREAYGLLPAHGNGSNPYTAHNFIRKMSCSFGWDWGPVLIGAGIHRPVRLEAWSGTRVGDVRCETSRLDPAAGSATLRVDADASGACGVVLNAPDGSRVAETTLVGGTAELEVERPELWWPAGYGDQPLYTLTVTSESGHGVSRHVGLRTVALDTEEDGGRPGGVIDGLIPGSAMTLRVNGQPVWCRGANWIPDDIFPSRVTETDLRERIGQARDANMNMLRVWGGGQYESDEFYDLCDELGLMVWQDFAFACAAYPEDADYAAEVEAEASDNVSRLTGHPSLVLWNGCNENLWIHHEVEYQGRSWPDLIGDRGWGWTYYFETLPTVVQRFAPSTPYWPGSPSNGPEDRDPTTWHPNAEHRGNRHIWEVWHGPGQYRNYRTAGTRFASEFGYHGPPTWPTIEAFVPDADVAELTWDHRLLEFHNRNSSANGGQAHTHRRIGDDFDADAVGADLADWLYCAQVMQARALDTGVGWYRALHPYCSGALFWQLNDCWPVSSWSAIDGLGKRKPLWYAMRRTMAPRLIGIHPAAVQREGLHTVDPHPPLRVVLHNDTAEAWVGRLTLEAWPLDGDRPVADHTEPVRVEPFSTAALEVPDHMPPMLPLCAAMSPSAVDLAPTAPPAAGWWWPMPDREMRFTPPEEAIEAAAHPVPGGVEVTVVARRLVRDLCCFADRVDPDADVSDQAVTLRPGDCFTFKVSGRFGDTTPLLRPPVLQSANRFGKR